MIDYEKIKDTLNEVLDAIAEGNNVVIDLQIGKDETGTALRINGGIYLYDEDSDSDEDEDIDQKTDNEKECKALREDFENYMTKIDDDVFSDALDILSEDSEDKIITYNENIFNNDDDPDTMLTAIKAVKNAIRIAFRNKISKLKQAMLATGMDPA